MTPRETHIAMVRHFAPPFVTTGQLDRRGARLYLVNCRAVEFARDAGLRLEDVYPGAMKALRHLAPPAGSPEALVFAEEAGVPAGDLYPVRVAFGGEVGPQRRWRWGWALAGALIGAALVGPVGAAAMGAAGGFMGGTR
jgi:hypothetical protein